MSLPSAIEQMLRQYVQHHCAPEGLESLQFMPQDTHMLLLADAPPAPIARLPRPIMLAQLAQEVARWQAHRAQRLALCEDGRWRLDVNLRMLCGASGEIALTDKETALLQQLVQAAPNALSRAALLESVWRYDDQVESHTIESHIYRLRQKLEPTGLAPKLATDAEGYRWCCEGLPARS